MPHSVPTVRVVSPISEENPHGYIVINQADFDHARHDAWREAAPGAATAAEPDGGTDDTTETAEAAGDAASPAGRGKRRVRA